MENLQWCPNGQPDYGIGEGEGMTTWSKEGYDELDKGLRDALEKGLCNALDGMTTWRKVWYDDLEKGLHGDLEKGLV